MAAANSKNSSASSHASGGYSMSGAKSIIPRRKFVFLIYMYSVPLLTLEILS